MCIIVIALGILRIVFCYYSKTPKATNFTEERGLLRVHSFGKFVAQWAPLAQLLVVSFLWTEGHGGTACHERVSTHVCNHAVSNRTTRF